MKTQKAGLGIPYLLSRADVAQIKGWAILLMVFLHVLGFPERWPSDAHVLSVFPFQIGGLPLEVIVAKAGKVCVSMFLFVSGYGMAISGPDGATWRTVVRRAYGFLKVYWLVFAAFVPLAFAMYSFQGLGGSLFAQEYGGEARYAMHPLDVIRSVAGFSNRYNAEWWFVGMYLCLLALWPVLFRLISRGWAGGLGVAALFWLAGKAGENVGFAGLAYVGEWGWPLALGAWCASSPGYLRLSGWMRSNPRSWLMLIFFVAYPFGRIFLMKITALSGFPVSLFDGVWMALCVVPLARLAPKLSMRVGAFLSYLGTRSVWIWLCHSFFCYYLFSSIVYFLSYGLAALAVTMIMSCLAAELLLLVTRRFPMVYLARS